MASESGKTVGLALAANALIGVAKLAGGLVSGSSSMLAEAAHSMADTLNEVFLLAGLRTSRRPPDAAHPFGYGKARFFWSLLAAFGIFVAGAVFSVWEGVSTLLHGERSRSVLVPMVVLGVALLAEGTSWLRALRQLRAAARRSGHGLLTELRRGKDPTVKTVLSEDTAAVAGVLLAAAGVGLHALTGSAAWDGAAAVAIGALLAVVAVLLGRDNQKHLLDATAEPEVVVAIHELIAGAPEVRDVVELLTMHLGPDSVLVAARVALREGLSAEEIERFSTRVEEQLHADHPDVSQVFLDPTRHDADLVGRTRENVARLGGRP